MGNYAAIASYICIILIYVFTTEKLYGKETNTSDY